MISMVGLYIEAFMVPVISTTYESTNDINTL